MKLEQKIPPLVQVLIFATVMFFTHQLYSPIVLSYDFQVIGAIAFICSGFLFALLGVLSFKKHKTTVNPMNTDKVSALVDSGVFRYTRNPMYVGMLFGLIGWAIYLGNPLNIIGCAGFVWYMNKYQITPEEAFLTTLFGDDYLSYRARVRRWL